MDFIKRNLFEILIIIFIPISIFLFFYEILWIENKIIDQEISTIQKELSALPQYAQEQIIKKISEEYDEAFSDALTENVRSLNPTTETGHE